MANSEMKYLNEIQHAEVLEKYSWRRKGKTKYTEKLRTYQSYFFVCCIVKPMIYLKVMAWIQQFPWTPSYSVCACTNTRPVVKTERWQIPEGQWNSYKYKSFLVYDICFIHKSYA